MRVNWLVDWLSGYSQTSKRKEAPSGHRVTLIRYSRPTHLLKSCGDLQDWCLHFCILWYWFCWSFQVGYFLRMLVNISSCCLSLWTDFYSQIIINFSHFSRFRRFSKSIKTTCPSKGLWQFSLVTPTTDETRHIAECTCMLSTIRIQILETGLHTFLKELVGRIW